MNRNLEIEEKQKVQNEANAKKLGQLTQCVAIASSSPEGIIAFRQIMNMCGYNKSVVSGTTQN